MNSFKLSVKKDCKDDTDELMLIYQTMSSCRDQVRIAEDDYRYTMNKLSEEADIKVRICQENLKKAEDNEKKFNTEIRAQETMRE